MEDDIEIIVDASGFARSEAARSAERPRRTLREWWMASTPMERILRLWWWCVCAVGGAVVGLAGGVMIGALVLLA